MRSVVRSLAWRKWRLVFIIGSMIGSTLLASVGAAGTTGSTDSSNGKARFNLLAQSVVSAETVSAPTGLRSSASTATGMTLSWLPSTSTAGTIARYEIYNGSTLAGTSTTTSYQMSNLTSGQAYTISVKAVDSVGNISGSSTSVTVHAVVDANEPDDTAASALTIHYAFRYLANISSATDVDYYKFTASAAANHITINVPPAKNYDVTIYDSSMNIVAQGSNPANQWEEVTFPVTPGAAYYMKVSGVSGQYSAVTYQLYLTQATKQYVYNASGHLIQTYIQKGLHRHQADMQYDMNGNRVRKITTKQIFGFLDQDESPASGSIKAFGYNGILGMDNSNRSIGVDLGSVRGIAKLEMKDSDQSTRIAEANYRIFKSNDNVTYTAVSGWTFNESTVNNRKVHAFSFNGLSARYLKVSTTFTDASSTFLMKIQDDIKLYLNQ